MGANYVRKDSNIWKLYTYWCLRIKLFKNIFLVDWGIFPWKSRLLVWLVFQIFDSMGKEWIYSAASVDRSLSSQYLSNDLFFYIQGQHANFKSFVGALFSDRNPIPPHSTDVIWLLPWQFGSSRRMSDKWIKENFSLWLASVKEIREKPTPKKGSE